MLRHLDLSCVACVPQDLILNSCAFTISRVMELQGTSLIFYWVFINMFLASFPLFAPVFFVDTQSWCAQSYGKSPGRSS